MIVSSHETFENLRNQEISSLLDAQVEVLGLLVDSYLGPKKHYGQELKDELPEILRRVTWNNCENATMFIAQYLELFHKSNFKEVLRVKGLPNKPFLRRSWDAHYYTIAQGKSGNYYALSPANYGIEGSNPLNTIIEGNNIQSIVVQIQVLEGGDWLTNNPQNIWNQQNSSLDVLKVGYADPELSKGFRTLKEVLRDYHNTEERSVEEIKTFLSQ